MQRTSSSVLSQHEAAPILLELRSNLTCPVLRPPRMPVLSSLESIYTSSDASTSKHSQADRLQGIISKEPTDANVLEISSMTHNE